MKKSDMGDFMNIEMWTERVQDTVSKWGKLQGIEVPDEVRDTVVNFMRSKIEHASIRNKPLKNVFFQIAVTALLYIKMKKF